MATSFAQRLAEIGKLWVKTKKAERSSVPDGRYQAEIVKAQMQEVKSGKSQGAPIIVLSFKILAGDFKGQSTHRTYWLHAINKKTGESVGIAFLKRDLETLSIDEPKVFSEKTLKKVLENMLGCCIELTVKERDNGFNDVYIDRMIDAPGEKDEDDEPEADDDEDGDDDEDSEDDDAESEDDDEEDAEAEDSEDSEDAEDEDDEGDEDDVDEDDEDDEEEKPAPKKRGRPAGSKNKPKAPPEKTKKGKKVEVDDDEAEADKLFEDALGD